MTPGRVLSAPGFLSGMKRASPRGVRPPAPPGSTRSCTHASACGTGYPGLGVGFFPSLFLWRAFWKQHWGEGSAGSSRVHHAGGKASRQGDSIPNLLGSAQSLFPQ